MAEINKVVVHYMNGKLVKGTTQDFFPNRPLFHMQPNDGSPTNEVRTRDLKAVFFVKDYTGNASRKDIRGFVEGPGETTQGKKIAVRFKDGEFLCGYSLSYSPDRLGFFMFPADANSNNLRVFVVGTATLEVKAGPAADLLATKVMNQSDSQAA